MIHRTGYQGRLNDEQMEAVEAFVASHLILDARQVQSWILEQYGTKYGITGVHALLHRLGFRYKEITGYPSKMDPVEQADFNAFYEDLLENLPENIVLFFMDAVHPEHREASPWGTIPGPVKPGLSMGSKSFNPPILPGNA